MPRCLDCKTKFFYQTREEPFEPCDCGNCRFEEEDERSADDDLDWEDSDNDLEGW